MSSISKGDHIDIWENVCLSYQKSMKSQFLEKKDESTKLLLKLKDAKAYIEKEKKRKRWK